MCLDALLCQWFNKVLYFCTNKYCEHWHFQSPLKLSTKDTHYNLDAPECCLTPNPYLVNTLVEMAWQNNFVISPNELVRKNIKEGGGYRKACENLFPREAVGTM